MAKTKNEEKAVDKQLKNKNSVSKYPFKFVEKHYNRTSLEGKFQKKIQTAVSGTEHTVTTESGKVIHRKHISGPIIFQTEKKKERAPQIGDKITPKNRHCLRGIDGKYIQWNEILRDILNGKLKIIQNRTRKSESESESEEGEIDEESDFEMQNFSVNFLDTKILGYFRKLVKNGKIKKLLTILPFLKIFSNKIFLISLQNS